MSKKYDIIFLCLAQNVDKTIQNLFNFNNQIKKENISSLVIIGENGSNDETVSIINSFAKNNSDIKLIKTDHIDAYKDRIVRLTHGRNYLKNYVLINKIYSTYISIIDVDNVINIEPNILDFKNVLHTLISNKNELFGISAKSKPYYYDMLNLYIEDFYEKDVLKIQSGKNIFNSFFLRKKNIYNFQLKITNINKDIRAVSAHNGFCVYLYDDYMLGNYMDIHNMEKMDDKVIPEHIIINKSIHKQTSKYMLISNDFFVQTPPEHMPYFNFSTFAKNKIKHLFSKLTFNKW